MLEGDDGLRPEQLYLGPLQRGRAPLGVHEAGRFHDQGRRPGLPGQVAQVVEAQDDRQHVATGRIIAGKAHPTRPGGRKGGRAGRLARERQDEAGWRAKGLLADVGVQVGDRLALGGQPAVEGAAEGALATIGRADNQDRATPAVDG
ncbi:MAG: hypothetical protein L0332_07225 [Chloroflexi bacterium]|nr:hypothetical protein [Chloroflexota bacterium]MCI0574750.1 hypothetical protein [Chloroflexota bacterium]MCI0645681.1 hypothetical protein [Chloroflexota bacterium]MCI0726501.1 hypothetical protein [Chloroflexota bacterium]